LLRFAALTGERAQRKEAVLKTNYIFHDPGREAEIG